MFINYPFHIDATGHTAKAAAGQHIRQLIEQVLFTSPGERVNRPSFGSGVKQLVFAPNSQELATAYQFLIQGALQQWLGDLIRVSKVQIENEDANLNITINYLILQTNESRTERFINTSLNQV